MAQNTKLRLLYVLEILNRETDENHILSSVEINERLNKYGLSADRRSIYADIETLMQYGYDINIRKGNDHGYYMGNRRFELAELKVLVDAVQVSRSLSEKKTEDLIRKLEALTSHPRARELRSQIVLTNRPKSPNEAVFYNIDTIHTAIYRNRKIAFQYAEWTADKRFRLKRGGAPYVVSPWAMLWDDERYYLVAFSDRDLEIRHYRVDKMKSVEILESGRDGLSEFNDLDLSGYEKKVFGMFSGTDENVTLLCKNELAGVIIDRFGSDLFMIPAESENRDSFRVTVPITVSRQFFGWVTSIGPEMKIDGPQKVVDEYRKYLDEIRGGYEAQ